MKSFNAHRSLLVIFFTAFFMTMLCESSAQVRVTRISAPDELTERRGVVYTLPRSVVEVELFITKTQQVPGPLAAYARDYLGLQEVVTKASVAYTLEGAELLVMTEPDPDRVYLIEKEEKSTGEIWLAFGKSGQPVKMERFFKETKPTGFEAWGDPIFLTPHSDQLFSKYSESSKREVIDTIIRKVSVDTLIMEQTIFKRSMVGFTDKEKAEEAVDKINQIEQDKYNLLVGYQETAYSGEALEFMFNKLEEEQIEYRKLFTGVVIKERYAVKFFVTPNPALEGQTYQLTGFSKTNGVVATDAQNAVTLSFIRGKYLPGIGEAGPATAAMGMVYRLPEKAEAVVAHRGVVIGRKMMEILQFGPVYTLPPEFKRAAFDIETGTLRYLILE
ncbi:MAG: DUF4831 family protein [Bacteroidales bacterium]